MRRSSASSATRSLRRPTSASSSDTRKLFTGYWVLLEGLPAVVSGRCDAGLAARLVDVQAGVEVGLDLAEDGRDLVRSGSFSHGSLPGSLPVVRFPLRLDQVLGGRPLYSMIRPSRL